MPSAQSRSGRVPTRTRRGAAGSGGSAAAPFRAKVRLYRHGLGDCILVTLPRTDGSNYYILIDCGVILGTPDADQVMTKVLEDVARTTGGKVDLLIATHEHWDHVSGFVLAGAAFDKLAVDQVWLPWTEDPNDDLARTLAAERAAALAGLRLAVNRLQLAGDEDNASAIGSLLEFFGAAGGASTRGALEAVRKKTAAPRYCRPHDDPVDLRDPKARLYVLGPPHDETLIRRTRPSTRQPETYGLALAAFRSNIEGALDREPPEAPFGARYVLPNPVAEEMDFFKRYWTDEAWRRIDATWLDGSAELALQLDSATNNTSLVLAVELDNGDVLLFAADAQVGNWLSWQDLSWTLGDRTVTGPELLRRTILYKVGHHGSHNATLREKGLEMMDNLGFALIPVNREMALQKGWPRIPLPELVAALEKQTNGGVLRADQDVPANLAQRVVATDLYFEVAL